MARRVLIVDDDADIRAVLKEYLTAKGFEVAACENAESALVLVLKEKFDAVMLDINLPGLSGLKAIHSFTGEGGGTAVYLMTGHADTELEKDAVLLGAKGFFAKPLDLAAVLHKLGGSAPAKS